MSSFFQKPSGVLVEHLVTENKQKVLLLRAALVSPAAEERQVT